MATAPLSGVSSSCASTTPCRFFQSPQGCFRGDSCAFRHIPVQDSGPMTSSQCATGQDGAGTSDTSNGNHHSAMPAFVKPNVYVPTPTNLSMDQAPMCRFFMTEQGCRNGACCPYVHIGSGGAGEANSVTQQSSFSPNSDNGSCSINSASSTHTTTRRRVEIQANPQKTPGNHEMLSEVIPVLTRGMEGPFFAIDVECVATGKGTFDRDVARIAMVDEHEQVFFDQYVKPEKPIVSYLTQLTGITESDLRDAPSLKEALVKLRAILPKNSVIVGQSINKDLTWLGLEQDVDYKAMFDVADLFRIPMLTNGSIHYRYFSLRHVAKYLLGTNIQEADHDPVIDAKYAMKVFKQFRYLHETPAHRDAVYQTLLKTPRTPSFADRYPVIDGVDMRAPKKRFPKRRPFHPGDNG